MIRRRKDKKGVAAPIIELILVLVTVLVVIAAMTYIIGRFDLFFREEVIETPIAVSVVSAYLTNNGVELVLNVSNKGYEPYDLKVIAVIGPNFILEENLNLTVNPGETHLITIAPSDWDKVSGTLPSPGDIVTVTIRVIVPELGVFNFTVRLS